MRSTVLTAFLLFAVASSRAGGAVEILYWPSSNPEEIELARILVGEWNKKHPEIQVKMQPLPATTSSEEVLLSAIVSGTTPDVCSNILPAIMGRFTRSKAVVSLDRFKDHEKVMYDRISPKIVDKFRSKDGKLYQVPWKCNPMMLAYSTKLFKSLGLKPPRTYSEFVDVARTLTKDLDGDGILDRWGMGVAIKTVWWQRFFDFFPFYVAATGGLTLLKDDKAIFNNEGAVTVMKFFREGFEKDFFPMLSSANEVSDAFLQGKVGLLPLGPWAIKKYEKIDPGFELDFSPIPVPDGHEGPSYTYGDPKNIVMFSTTKHPDEAWEFVKFLITRDADLKLLEITNQIPIRRDLAKDPYFSKFFEEEPVLKKIAEQAGYVAPIDESPHVVQILDIISRQFEACAVYGLVPPEEAVRKAAEQVQIIYDYW